MKTAGIDSIWTAGVGMDPPPGNSNISTSGRHGKGGASGTTGRLGWAVGDNGQAMHGSFSNKSPFVMCETAGVGNRLPWTA